MNVDYLPGLILFSVFLGLILTVVVSTVTLSRYRSAVSRSMREARGSGVEPEAPGQQTTKSEMATGEPLKLIEIDPRDFEGGQAEAFANDQRLGTVRACLLSGLAHTFVATVLIICANFLSEPQPFAFKRLLVLWAIMAWPVIPTISVVGSYGLKAAAMAVVPLIILVVWVGPSILTTAAYFVGIPLIVALVITNRRVRAVASFVIAGSFSLVFILFFAVQTALALGEFFGSDVFVLAFVAAIASTAIVASLLGHRVLSWLAKRYRAKRTSDQLLMINSWWFAYTLWICMVLSVTWGICGLAGLAAFIVYRVVLGLQLPALAESARNGPCPRLLLLRVFGHRRRSEDLLSTFGHLWRYLGSIQLIAGPDLATITLEPHEVVEFFGGRLSRQFVSDSGDLERLLAEQDLEPDPDGRFRVSEAFCHDNTWHRTLQELASNADVAVMDLRSFSIANKGCEYELGQLVELVPLERVLLLTDASTDHPLLEDILREKWKIVGRASVNQGRRDPSISTAQVPDKTRNAASQLMGQLCRMAC